MLKHKDLIEKLSVTEKIALLVGADAVAKNADAIPQLRIADLWASNEAEQGQGIFPSASSLMNSFNLSTSIPYISAMVLSSFSTSSSVTSMFSLFAISLITRLDLTLSSACSLYCSLKESGVIPVNCIYCSKLKPCEESL